MSGFRSEELTLAALVAASSTITGCASTRAADDTGGPMAQHAGAKQASGQTMTEIFAGKFPGVQVFRAPGGGISLRIRGAGTIANNGEPLFVIDGVRVMSGNGGLLFMNPADIDTIEVLKDISSLSFYGIDGANGVVLITTKRGG